jgi:hypothetical protein
LRGRNRKVIAVRKFIAVPCTGRLVVATCVVVLALAASASAAELTDKQKNDLENACYAATDVCYNSCGAKYPNREQFNDGLLYDLCTRDCNITESRCLISIPARTIGGGSSGGGPVLDPGTGNPPPPSFNPKPYSLPGSGVLDPGTGNTVKPKLQQLPTTQGVTQ